MKKKGARRAAKPATAPMHAALGPQLTFSSEAPAAAATSTKNNDPNPAIFSATSHAQQSLAAPEVRLELVFSSHPIGQLHA